MAIHDFDARTLPLKQYRVHLYLSEDSVVSEIECFAMRVRSEILQGVICQRSRRRPSGCFLGLVDSACADDPPELRIDEFSRSPVCLILSLARYVLGIC